MKIYFNILAVFLVLLLVAPASAQELSQANNDKILVELVERGYLAQRSGKLDEALTIYSGIIQRRGLTSRQRAITYLLRGEVKRDQGKLDEAVLDFTRALKQWNNYPHALFSRAKIYEKQNKLMEAYADLARATDIDPNREMYQNHLALLRKQMNEAGLVLQDSGDAPQPFDPPLPEEQ